MKFAFSAQQREFQRAVKDLLAKRCAPANVREAWTNATGRTGVWPAIAEMGVAGMTVPESAGGLGMNEIDLVLLMEETGRACLAEPIVETTAVAAPLLGSARDSRAAALARGELCATAVAPTDEFAVWADSSDLVVLFESTGVHVVERDAARLEPRPSVDASRRLFWVAADTSASTLVGDGEATALALDRGALATAAQLVGLGGWMLDAAVAYAAAREQFGAPIGSFQAVKHRLADARLGLEFAAPLVYRAAWSVANDVEHRAVHVSLAKAQASDAAQATARAALQVHGAIGYTTEFDLHMYMKRTWALARSWGDAAWHRRRIADVVLDPRRDLSSI